MAIRSVHISDAEAEGLQHLHASTGQAEGALLERAVQHGLHELRIDAGIKPVDTGGGSSEGAEIAGTPREVSLDLLYERRVKILDGPSIFAENLAILAEDLGDERLAATACWLTAEKS